MVKIIAWNDENVHIISIEDNSHTC